MMRKPIRFSAVERMLLGLLGLLLLLGFLQGRTHEEYLAAKREEERSE
jgi:hypothetical protein